MSDDGPIVPFIPDDDGPIIPNLLLELRRYRYIASKTSWKHVSMAEGPKEKPCPSQVRLITWNIDFSTQHHSERLVAALRHIEQDVLKCKLNEPPEPCCILLQEVNARVMPDLLADVWVRRFFYVTPITTKKWPDSASYSNFTLVARSLTLVGSQVIHFGLTKFHRGGVVAYIKLSAPKPKAREDIICIVNTHLESLPDAAEARAHQLGILTRIAKQDDYQGAVIAGDMNALEPSDASIVRDYGLRDAWKKGNKDPKGNTWGYQGGGDFPHARLDKILYVPGKGYKVDEPTRIGVGKTIDDGKTWISDHYGLDTTVRMV